ncbi:GNAT family N-acetyltransferase [Arthrobacter bambusae]|uniref:GNAT family N-acetyltransferase n=1 Tax=Arthrobacter bambusae TaxID=1338426 RepID=UPI00277FA035|nr:GNAT family N-acetyltransferase [Arthrobacter bambusae]MDQ0213073.1 putative acetyltransferase [Arthrobacter bambusae]MDQ0237361.1 putative acetyltransferase [Arthrobacter bambusae]
MSLLVRPSVALYAAWMEAHKEWGDGLHEDGFGLVEADDVRSLEGFRVFVDRLLAKEASNCDDGGTFRWIVEDGEVLGGIALRHEPTQGAEALGHGGYGLRPSARGRGLAAVALREMLYLAKARNTDRVVLACFVDNVPSVKTIERCGGVLNRIVTTDRGEVGRYTIRLS